MMMMASPLTDRQVRHSYSREELLQTYRVMNSRGALHDRDNSSLGERPSALRFSRNRKSNMGRTSSEAEGAIEAATLAAGLEGLAALSDPNAPPPALGMDPMVMSHPLAGMPGGPIVPGGKGASADANLMFAGFDASGNPIFQEPMIIDPITGWHCTLSQYNAQFHQFQGSSLMANVAAATPTSTGKGMNIETPMNADGKPKMDHETAHREAYKLALGKNKTDGVTLMLKNIPNKYNRQMLVELLMRRYRGKINFLYMPIDFKTDCNCGYSFLNFRSEELASQFLKEFHDVHTVKCLPGYNSNKVAQVTRAAVQGLKSNMDRLKKSPLLIEWRKNDDWQPLLFNENGDEIPFPCEGPEDGNLNSPSKGLGKRATHGGERSPTGNSSNFTISRSKSGGRGTGAYESEDQARTSTNPGRTSSEGQYSAASSPSNKSKGASGKSPKGNGRSPTSYNFNAGPRAFPHTVGGYEGAKGTKGAYQASAGKKGANNGKGKNAGNGSVRQSNKGQGKDFSRNSSQQGNSVSFNAPPPALLSPFGNNFLEPTMSHQSVYSNSKVSVGSNPFDPALGYTTNMAGVTPFAQMGVNSMPMSNMTTPMMSPTGNLMPMADASMGLTMTPNGLVMPTAADPASPASSPANPHDVSTPASLKFTETGRTEASKKMSSNVKNTIVRKQITDLFDTDQIRSQDDIDCVDRQLLSRSMVDAQGWIPISAFMQLKKIYFPGHENMVQLLRESQYFEVKGAEKKELFRLSDTKKLNRWVKLVQKASVSKKATK